MTAPPRTTTSERARVLIDAWDEHGEELQFVENAKGTTVHVVARDRGPTTDSGPTAFGLSFEHILDLEMGAVYTVCGTRVRCNRGGHEEGGRLTGRFADDLLCVRCHSAFGERADLIFECNPETEPTRTLEEMDGI
ncbi:hypothetical protein [Actinomadura sp. 3N407]|uniref:hypothetical protein n=1 Tax=Actinomadura sp. 3N407 TaxID=3457423 RepID=UPI003FCD59EE